MCSVLSSYVVFSSTMKVNDALNLATEITRKIFTANVEDDESIGFVLFAWYGR